MRGKVEMSAPVRLVVSSLVISAGRASADAGEDDNYRAGFADRALRARKKQRAAAQVYRGVRFIPPTSNAVELLFSKARHVLLLHRHKTPDSRAHVLVHAAPDAPLEKTLAVAAIMDGTPSGALLSTTGLAGLANRGLPGRATGHRWLAAGYQRPTTVGELLISLDSPTVASLGELLATKTLVAAGDKGRGTLDTEGELLETKDVLDPKTMAPVDELPKTKGTVKLLYIKRV
ncbi:hypothetical protein PHYSODRAFT_328395 [Phytophthora sojae]|uniref:Uncharacterized protein n=1 Tax=Phytophthora sojae (strain P6497) TaxID=1094619 RepID=G4Z5Y7_PHYSP|nr:hypothetical protein PHYSODRAFT_328395 [Phytophthora sojae]EGZ20266.1 hypothetical protein PHYSODRAFT_328395 [Phytophthora sojae]|eukprot:XP_009522983.1 hypothetical protein PHYSODRAFT_328395 [Phytophthora sojae]